MNKEGLGFLATRALEEIGARLIIEYLDHWTEAIVGVT